MKFTELKKTLQSQVDTCYFVSGEDIFLINSSIELIEKALFGSAMRNNLNKQVFSTEETDISSLLTALNTMPFFAEKKLVVLQHYDSKIASDTISQLALYMKSTCPSTVLVIACMQDSTNFDSLKKYCTLVDCSRLDKATTERVIKAKLKTSNATIEQDALNLLLDYTNGYLSKIMLEIDKLVALSGGNILAEHVKECVSKDLEYSIFELTNCLISGNYKRVFQIKQDLMSNRKTMGSVLGIIQNYYRRLFYSIVSSGEIGDIAKKLKVKDSAILIAKKQATKIGARKLKNIVELCAQLDYKVKSSQISIENATDYLLGFIIA